MMKGLDVRRASVPQLRYIYTAMVMTISHDIAEETPEAKARWFQSLPLSERMDLLCFFTDLVLENNPQVVEHKDAEPIAGRVRVLSKARG
jgi:hypothetical protein